MKILFLDFDGVLNSIKYIRRCSCEGLCIDPLRMHLLKKIIDATNAKIVLTTSWREHWDECDSLCDDIGKEINRIFEEYSLKIYSKTPVLRYHRENEIEEWIEKNGPIENFAILDDQFLYAEFIKDRFVRTSNIRNGIDENDVEKVIKILNT